MSARLVVQRGPYPNQEYPLSEAPMSLGRSPDNDIAIQDPEVSRRHALISFSGGLYQIEDTGSTNGSFVNGRRVQGTVILQHGDILQLGESITLIFQEDTPAAGYADDWADDWSPDNWSPDDELTDDDWAEADSWEPAAASAPRPPTAESPTQFYPPQPAQVEQSAPPAASFGEADAGPSRTRQLLLGCGCGFLLFGVLCVGLLFFLDAYDQGRLLYCGPLYPFFDALLGPVGFNPACPPPS